MRIFAMNKKSKNTCLSHSGFQLFAGVSLFFILASACGSSDNRGDLGLPDPARAGGPARAGALLESKSGSAIQGSLKLEELSDGQGVRIFGTLKGLAPLGQHGIHVHEVGDCSDSQAKNAGEHFNPDNRAHGALRTIENATHAGDLGNIIANSDGVAQVEIVSPLLTLSSGQFAIGDRAIVVHEKADNLASQPAGDSGTRVACGVIRVE